MELKIFPWEDVEKKPILINEEGFEWWVDEDLSLYAMREDSTGHQPLVAVCFMVRKNGEFLSRVLIENETQNILADVKGLEEMTSKIDRLRAERQVKT